MTDPDQEGFGDPVPGENEAVSEEPDPKETK